MTDKTQWFCYRITIKSRGGRQKGNRVLHRDGNGKRRGGRHTRSWSLSCSRARAAADALYTDTARLTPGRPPRSLLRGRLACCRGFTLMVRFFITAALESFFWYFTAARAWTDKVYAGISGERRGPAVQSGRSPFA